ncbi:hypothetical protein OAS39_03135, partial [Pirellulales bacterium]|nr:hypothetical protein [Pirellulales bacterium]
MRPRDWMRILWGPTPSSKGRRRNGWGADELVARLNVKRLEERRVLNADAAPVEVLVVDAGDSGGDGQADSYYVQHDAESIRVSVNGQEIAAGLTADVNEIRIRGSADNDVLVADLLAGVDLVFDGGAGDDQLVVVGDQSYDQVAYEVQPDGSARIDATGPDGDVAIRTSGVEAIRDARDADARTFNVAADGRHVTLSAGNDAGTSSTLVIDGRRQLEIEFDNPADTLHVDTSRDASGEDHAGTDRVDLAGLGSQFDADLQITGSADDSLYLVGETDLGAG